MNNTDPSGLAECQIIDYEFKGKRNTRVQCAVEDEETGEMRVTGERTFEDLSDDQVELTTHLAKRLNPASSLGKINNLRKVNKILQTKPNVQNKGPIRLKLSPKPKIKSRTGIKPKKKRTRRLQREEKMRKKRLKKKQMDESKG